MLRLHAAMIGVNFALEMNFTIEHEQEEDGRWLAEVPELPGVLAYGATSQEAMAKAQALALRVLAEKIENSEAGPQPISPADIIHITHEHMGILEIFV